MAAEARQVAKQGVTAAEQANDAMRSVRESSAEQTNLLALNAAIEAARELAGNAEVLNQLVAQFKTNTV